MPIKTSASNEVAYGFSGIINGQPVSGWYSYSLCGGGPTGDFLSLYYTYHHRAVQVMGVLNIINPAHMEMTNAFVFHQHGDRDDNLATGFHIHYGDIIHLMRAGTALNILSPAITHTTNESCPHRMYLDQTLGVYHCHAAHGTRELNPRMILPSQWQRAW